MVINTVCLLSEQEMAPANHTQGTVAVLKCNVILSLSYKWWEILQRRCECNAIWRKTWIHKEKFVSRFESL